MSRPVVYLTRGLPGSGKSTWARAEAARTPGKVVLVNRDELRTMIDPTWRTRTGKKPDKALEKLVQHLRNEAIYKAVLAGQDVIVHDTNLPSKHDNEAGEPMWARQLLGHISGVPIADIEIADQFLRVPVEECIRRDLLREHSVGERVIRRMWREHLAPTVEPPVHDPALPECIIVDLDGTLAIKGDRDIYDDARCGEDTPCEAVIRTVRALWMANPHLAVICMSGRDEGRARQATVDWLNTHQVPYHMVLMRPSGDTRRDSLIKRELYDQHIAGRYRVLLVLDDRSQVVTETWRALGLNCFQVADGEF